MSATIYAILVIVAHVTSTVRLSTSRTERERPGSGYRRSLTLAAGFVAFALVIAAGLEVGAGETAEAQEWLIAALVVGVVLLGWIEIFWRWLKG